MPESLQFWRILRAIFDFRCQLDFRQNEVCSTQLKLRKDRNSHIGRCVSCCPLKSMGWKRLKDSPKMKKMQRSESPYGALFFFVKEEDKLRSNVDYRAINRIPKRNNALIIRSNKKSVCHGGGEVSHVLTWTPVFIKFLWPIWIYIELSSTCSSENLEISSCLWVLTALLICFNIRWMISSMTEPMGFCICTQLTFWCSERKKRVIIMIWISWCSSWKNWSMFL